MGSSEISRECHRAGCMHAVTWPLRDARRYTRVTIRLIIASILRSVVCKTASANRAESLCPIWHQALHQKDMVASSGTHSESIWRYGSTRRAAGFKLVAGVHDNISQRLQPPFEGLLRLWIQESSRGRLLLLHSRHGTACNHGAATSCSRSRGADAHWSRTCWRCSEHGQHWQ